MSRRWRLGTLWVVRHAGFPFDWIEQLGLSDAAASAADAVIEAERKLLAACGESRKLRDRVAEELAQGRVPQASKNGTPEMPAAIEALKTARATLESAWNGERPALRKNLWARATDKGIQEAVFLSSPAMYENVWSRYVANEDHPDNADNRRVERQVYTYLQRFCAKNETTSFFGPMAYGERSEDSHDIVVKPNPDRRRRTFFSFWAVTELAKAINKDGALTAQLPIRRNPLFELNGEVLSCEPLGIKFAIRGAMKRLYEIAEPSGTLARAAAELKVEVAQAEQLLAPLLKTTALVRGVLFPLNTFETFDALLSSVRELPEVPARDTWVRELTELAAKLKRFQESDLAGRRKLLEELEADYTRLTGVPARRGEGQIYSDRLVIYEESSSPFQIRFGAKFFERMERELSAPLELSAAYGQQVQAGHQKEVLKKLGPTGSEVDFLTYAVKTRPEQVSKSRFSPVPPVTIQEAEKAEVQVAEDHLGRSTPGARYALPDVCLGGPPATGEGADGYQIILARVHHHLLLYNWLAAFYPDRARFESVANRWLTGNPDGESLVQLTIRRRNKGFYVFPGKRLVYSVSDAADLAEGTLRPSDVRVRSGEQSPELYDKDGKRLHLYLALDDFSHYAPFASLTHPQVLHVAITSEGQHIPRVKVGEVTYQRERWRMSGAKVLTAKGLDLFLLLRREAQQRGWPRFVYVRSATERKPYLIDTRSPFALELLRHVAQDGAELTFEEMLPGPNELWLKDDRGRYTCELRMQAERWAEDAQG